MAALDGLDTDDVDRLAVRIFRWLVNPSRRLPTGVTVADLAGDDLGEFTGHVDGTLGGFAATAGRRGPRFALYTGRQCTVGWRARTGGAHRPGRNSSVPLFVPWTTPVTRIGDRTEPAGGGFHLSRHR
jgi:hypothetical protein